MTETTFLEIFQSIVLPALGAAGGITALIIFLLSKPQRKAEIEKIKAEAIKTNAEANHTINITEATLHKLTNDAAAKAIEGQKMLIDELQERLGEVLREMAALRCEKTSQDEIIRKLESKLDRLETELGLREANIVALEEKLKRYEEENREYRKENEILKKQVESQRKRIKELENQIVEIKRLYQERDNGYT